MARAVLALGANLQDPPAQLERAIALLAARGIVTMARSSMRVTEPWGDPDQGRFHNMALAVETDLAPLDLLRTSLAIEEEMGRVRLRKWGPRLIDIDIIAYECQVLSDPELTLPHPFAHERDFVLDPVREIAPDIADWLITRAATRPD